MEVIAQFRKLLLAQVMLGILAFCVAGQNVGLLVVAGGLVALSWYVVEGPTGRVLPNWVVVAGAGIAAAWVLLDLPHSRGGFVLGIGYFTMALQILLLFSRKSNREYAEILILSLMQMVGASVLDQSIIYGLLLTMYCILSIFTVVGFQLKVTADHVTAKTREGMPPSVAVAARNPVAGRGQRWQFRGTTMALGLVCAFIGAIVFVLAPRDDTQRTNTTPVLEAFRAKQVGFATEVDLTSTPDTANDNQPVLHMTVALDGEKIEGDRTIHLRGVALDYYDTTECKWKRSLGVDGGNSKHFLGPSEGGVDLPVPVPPGAHLLEGHVVLRTTSDNVLFTISPVVWVRAPELTDMTFNSFDERLTGKRTSAGPVEYDFRSLGTRFGPAAAGQEAAAPERAAGGTAGDAAGESGPESADEPYQGHNQHLRVWGVDGGRIREFSLQVLQEAGLTRDVHALSDPRDAKIGQALADYLRRHYAYSLTREPVRDGADPISDFLFHDKRGHCELFAAGLTAMLRSIGITSRVVSGFLVSEYNEVGGYYVVRQANAHAWVEAYDKGAGWQELDPTPGGNSEFRPAPRARTAFIRELYDHIQFAWLSSIVAYDQKTRAAVLDTVGGWAAVVIKWQTEQFQKVAEEARTIAHSRGTEQWQLALLVAGALAALMAAGTLVQAMVAKGYRVDALQLRGIPRAQRQALVRRLGFYLQTIELLDHYGLVRPTWQSPMSYAESLVRTDREHLGALTDLTSVFYEVRFGGRQVDGAVEARIQDYYGRLEEGLRKWRAARGHRRMG